VKPETLECAEYIFVLTTLNHELLSAAQIFEIYRARWSG
jgi:hypothetical protein